MMLALSTTGCLDPISTRWEATTFDNIPMPFSFEYNNQDGQVCTASLRITMEVYGDLSAALLYTNDVLCEGSAPENSTYVSSTGNTEILDKRTEYIISFDGGQFGIDCLIKKNDLNCVDLDGSAYSFRAD